MRKRHDEMVFEYPWHSGEIVVRPDALLYCRYKDAVAKLESPLRWLGQ